MITDLTVFSPTSQQQFYRKGSLGNFDASITSLSNLCLSEAITSLSAAFWLERQSCDRLSFHRPTVPPEPLIKPHLRGCPQPHLYFPEIGHPSLVLVMAQYPKYNLALRLAGTIFQLLLIILPFAIVLLCLLNALFAIAIAIYLVPLLAWGGSMALLALLLLLVGGVWASF